MKTEKSFTTAKWVSGPHPQKWAFKKEMPAHLRREAFRVNFGLFGVAFTARDENGRVLMRDGQRMETFSFYLKTPGYVIGPCDMQAASHKDWSIEWHTACVEKRMDTFNSHFDNPQPR